MDRQTLENHVRAMYDAFASADLDAYKTAFADDFVWHVPGNNPVSGAYRGSDEYFGTMVDRMAPLDRWDVSVRAVFTNEKDDAALVSFHVVGSRKGMDVDMSGWHMVRLNQRGQVVEGWGFTESQDALDEFFSL